MELTKEEQQIIEQIVTMEGKEIPMHLIAHHIGCTVEDIENLQELDYYKYIQKSQELARLSRGANRLDTWEAIEQAALKQVNDTLSHECDPDYALDVLKTTIRRKPEVVNGNNISFNTNDTVIINIPQHFLNKLQSPMPIVNNIDVVLPKAVTKLFHEVKDVGTDTN